jgi:hypothetical protein
MLRVFSGTEHLNMLTREVNIVPVHQGNPVHRPHNHTLYDIPPIRFVFQVTQKDLRSSLMMAGYCRNK